MNLFKTNPHKVFEVLMAMILVGMAHVIFTNLNRPKNVQVPVKGDPQVVEAIKKRGFGVIAVELDAPSLARSNFDVNPAGDITLYFTEEADPYDVESKLLIRDEETSEVLTANFVSVGVKDPNVPVNFMNMGWAQKMVFSPEKDLDPNSSYTISLAPGYFNKDGTKAASMGMQMSFTTSAEPGLLNATVEDGDTNVPLDTPVRLTFLSPLSTEEMEQKVQISPRNEFFYVLVQDKNLLVYGLEPGQTYTLYVPEDTVDMYGRVLGESIELSFTTAVN